jgi:beta-lactamase class A
MISSSDNTAADALLHIVGRETVESYTRRNQPFLTTQEAFKLKAAAHADLVARYHRGNEAEKRQVLKALDCLPLPALQALPTTPTLDVEWHFTTRELCGLMAQVEGLDMMTVSPSPGVVNPDQWARIAYKGGSELGVLNLTYWLKTKDGANYCIAATQNRADAPIDAQQFFGLYRALLGTL